MASFVRKYFRALIIVLAIPLGIYIFSAASYLSKCTKPRLSCLEHRKAGCNISGDYTVKLANKETEVTCDMDTDLGGWTLVANYLHRKSSSGEPQVLKTNVFPLQKKSLLGLDEVGTKAWGHVSVETMSTLAFKEARFRCQTTSHQRLIDFSISSEGCLNYLRTGKGSCLSSPESKNELIKGTRGLAGNGGFLPGIADKGWKDQGDFAMVNYPFFLDYKNHWAVGRLPGRFECDDYDSAASANTWHQVWVR